jgi:hypothetical protein
VVVVAAVMLFYPSSSCVIVRHRHAGFRGGGRRDADLDGGVAAAPGREDECGVAAPRCGVRVRAEAQEPIDRGGAVAHLRGEHERRLAVPVRRVDDRREGRCTVVCRPRVEPLADLGVAVQPRPPAPLGGVFK